jgi:hypothetical protein
MPKSLLPFAIALAFSACAPNPQSPVQVMAVVPLPDGTYGPQLVQIKTLTDAVALKGSVLDMTGGARIVVNSMDPQLSALGSNPTDDQLAQLYLKDKGTDVSANYIQKGDVLWPADFHTWNMVSTYYNFEKASAYFQTLGVTTEELDGAQVYYFPSFILTDQSAQPIQDNALFFSPEQAFMILPFQNLQAVPLAMNFGVVAHEYSHRVFNKRVYHGQDYPAPISVWADNPTLQTSPTRSIS